MSRQPDPVLDAQLRRDALERYERALADAAAARAAWEAAGSFLTVVLPNDIETVAPLWKIVLETEKHAARMARHLRAPARAGPKALGDAAPWAPPRPVGKTPGGRLRRADSPKPL